MELAARAGYDPAAGVTLWEKMSAAAKGAPPQWMSTHPSGESRIQLIKDHLKDVQPLYEKAKAARVSGAQPETLRKPPMRDVRPGAPADPRAGSSSGPDTWPRQVPLEGPRQ